MATAPLKEVAAFGRLPLSACNVRDEQLPKAYCQRALSRRAPPFDVSMPEKNVSTEDLSALPKVSELGRAYLLGTPPENLAC